MSRSPFEDLDREERKPQRRPREARRSSWPLLLIVLVVGGGGLFMCVVGGFVLFLFVQGVKPRPVVEGDLATLAAEWKRNPVAVVERHKGQVVRVRGYVRKVEQNIHHQTFIILAPTEKGEDWGEETAMVYLLSDSLVSRMKDHPIGSQVTVEVVFNEPSSHMKAVAVRVVSP
jgi:hypothetical protein